METPPPVPPKDFLSAKDMTPASGSKRKRAASEGASSIDERGGTIEVHSPKRSKPDNATVEPSTSDDASSPRRNLRRKKKHGNLSSLNLRHAAQRQAQSSGQAARESKFQEGSLTDKPSDKPPSVFTRIVRTDSGNMRHVEELMEDYHAAEGSSNEHVKNVPSQEKALMPQQCGGDGTGPEIKQQDVGGFFSFGKNFSMNFRPIALWNRLYGETKEQLTQRNYEAAMRKKQKEDAEAKYAQLKQAGQLGLKPVGNMVTAPHEVGSTGPEDTTMMMTNGCGPDEHYQIKSRTSLKLAPPPADDLSSIQGNEVPDTGSKHGGTFRSRFGFKRPSISNLKEGLKRVRSDLNMSSTTVNNRESSASLSPLKTDLESSTLRRSTSRFDLKKQNKLSKRVSDLEAKLQQARRELDEALIEASPMPKLPNKYERFTPQSTIKRPKFLPGKLPSLPSERVLMAQYNFGDDEESPLRTSEVKPRNALDLTDKVDDDSTIKAPYERQYPPRAASLFVLHDNEPADLNSVLNAKPNLTQHRTSEPIQFTSDANIDSKNLSFTSDGVPALEKPGGYDLMDNNLKALDENVNIAKNTPPESRMSVDEGDTAYRSDFDTDNGETDFSSTPRKKRKSTGGIKSSSQSKRIRGEAGTSISARRKNTKKCSGSSKNKQQTVTEAPLYSEDEKLDVEMGNDETFNAATSRTSLDSQGIPLEPVYEEEEETTVVALKDVPSKPTAKATPARYSRHASRSRSGSIQPGVEEQMMTRAAHVVQSSRHFSPPPGNENYKTVEVVEGTVTARPGEGNVPALPNKISGSTESINLTESEKQKEEFQWPDDVF
ncbi:hypothetical protein M433DRAFT_151689 [Acidomyces richmondensis BFW]|nr:MAG: hypothetical protein FE78DRAFT_85939 [Acidomyces sp. 'richmondensis']KYG47891.1 hypothetical protein M433DRAFT_151689 [Acidomyces richmondensis BFW]